jgi:hypothetical protein
VRRVLSVAAGLIFASVSVASVSSAQLAPSLSVRAGITMPLSDLETTHETGYNLGVGLGFKPLLSPVGVRVEAAFDQLGGKAPIDDARIFQATGNLTMDLMPLPTAALYLIGGGGLYNTKIGSTSSNKGGVNVGAGFRFGLAGIGAFAEARYHHVFLDNGSMKFVPISVGVSF